MCEIRVSPEAKNDLAEIKDYISKELYNPQASVRLVRGITERIRGLARHPRMGASLSTLVDIRTDLRFLVCGKYLVFYRFEDRQVFVLRVLYAGRDYVRILFGCLPQQDEE